MTTSEQPGATDRHHARRDKSLRRRKASRYVGLLDRHEERLVALIEELLATPDLDATTLDRVVRRHPGETGPFSRSDIILAWRHLKEARGWDDDRFAERIRMKPVRTDSGVVPVTVLTRPHPCPGRCVFCPSDTRMPKSYLSMEPGAQRATQNRFDPYQQTWSRLRAFANNGHPVDKVELIVLGGTFTSYPRDYQVWFVKRCFDALNRFDVSTDPETPAVGLDFLDLAEEVDGARGVRSYNEIVSGYLTRSDDASRLREAEKATIDELIDAQRINERAACRSVGLSLETRPDEVDEEQAVQLRRLGATKVQLGIQSLDDEVLLRSRRGHDVAATRRAVGVLRRAGFKVQAHWMPNLLGATPERDVVDFRRLFDDPGVRPDELKIYPTMLIDSAELMRHHERGEWSPYDESTLESVLRQNLRDVPRWCRVSRVIRDIPAHDVVAGSHRSNLRQTVERGLHAEGRRPADIRARQIRRPLRDDEPVALRETVYDARDGREVFIEAGTADDELVGFVRLSLPRRRSFIDELGDAAILREVHVYGAVTPIDAEPGHAQHRGVGRRLIARAEAIARAARRDRIAVISAVGTREYYRRLGYRDGELYPWRSLG